MKKFFIVILNIITCIILTEFMCFYKDAYEFSSCFCQNWKNLTVFEKIKYINSNVKYSFYEYKDFDEVYEILKTKLRKPIGLQYKKKPVLLMGCSFAYGYKLDEKDTISYKLSEIMKRPVYNRAYELWWGLQTMLYQSRRDDFYKEVPEPEYIVYIFINDHINRVLTSVISLLLKYPHLRYIMHNNRLEREKFSIKYNLFMFRNYTVYRYKYLKKNTDIPSLVNEYFIETKQEFDKHWQNYKFVILTFEKAELDKKTLEENGFILIDVKDLTGRYFNNTDTDFISDKTHPNGYVWSIVAPKLADKLNKL